MLQLGDTEKFPHALGFESLDPFFQSEQAGSMFHSHRGGMEVIRDLQSMNLLAKLMVLHRQVLYSLAIAAIVEAILMPTSAEQVTLLHTLLTDT